MMTIDELQKRVDIVELVTDMVGDLTLKGKVYARPCPFHEGDASSFAVFPEHQTWHCFGACAMGGDAFSFVMRRNGVTLEEAVKILEERYA